VQNFIRDENLKLYRQALIDCTNDDQRQVLLNLVRLLVKEQVPEAPRLA
jgi:hypothetical protein